MKKIIFTVAAVLAFSATAEAAVVTDAPISGTVGFVDGSVLSGVVAVGDPVSGTVDFDDGNGFVSEITLILPGFGRDLTLADFDDPIFVDLLPDPPFYSPPPYSLDATASLPPPNPYTGTEELTIVFSGIASLNGRGTFEILDEDYTPIVSGDLLVAVPLPAALPLMGTALAAFGVLGWRTRAAV